MPVQNKKRSHDEARKVVCVLCFQKANNSRKISEKYSNLIKSFIPDFIINNGLYPSGLCATCRINLDKGKKIKLADYDDKNLVKNENENPCDCDICAVSKSNQHLYFKTQNLVKPKKGRPRLSSPKKRLSLCSKCFTELHRGKAHVCTVRSKVENVVRKSGEHHEQVASQILKDVTNSTPSSSKIPTTVTLKRGRGVPLNVVLPNKRLKSSIESPPVVGLDTLRNIQLRNGQNINQMEKTVHALREGKVPVQWGAMSKLKNETHDLDSFFTVESIAIDVDKNLTKPVSVVYCNDLNGLVSYLMDKRGTTDDFFCKIGIDGGGGSLKVCKRFPFNILLLLYLSYLSVRIVLYVSSAYFKA